MSFGGSPTSPVGHSRIACRIGWLDNPLAFATIRRAKNFKEGIMEKQDVTSWPLSNTQLNILGTCARKYEYMYVWGRKESVGPPAIFSRAVAHPLLVRKAFGLPIQEQDVEDAYNDFLTEAGEVLRFHALWNLGLAKRIVETYELPAGVRATQGEKSLELAGSRGQVIYKARVDLVAEDGKGVFPLDFKLNQKPSHERNTVPFHNQFVGQAVVLGVLRFMVAELCVSVTKKGGLAVEVDHTMVHFGEDMQAEFVTEVEAEWERRRLYANLNAWPKNAPDGCFKYGAPCDFVNVCRAGAFRLNVLEGVAQKGYRK